MVSSFDLAVARFVEIDRHMLLTSRKGSELVWALLHTCTSTYTTEDFTESSGYVSPPRINSKKLAERIMWLINFVTCYDRLTIRFYYCIIE